MMLGCGNPEIGEEYVAHVHIVVLPRVDKNRIKLFGNTQHQVEHGSDLREIGPRADHEDNFQSIRDELHPKR